MTTCSDHLRSFFCLRRLSIHMVVRQGKWEALLLGRLRTRCAEMCLWHWPQLHRSQILLQLWCRSETMVRSYSLLFLLKESRAYTLDGFCRRQERKASCTQSRWPHSYMGCFDYPGCVGMAYHHTMFLQYLCCIIYYHSNVWVSCCLRNFSDHFLNISEHFLFLKQLYCLIFLLETVVILSRNLWWIHGWSICFYI